LFEYLLVIRRLHRRCNNGYENKQWQKEFIDDINKLFNDYDDIGLIEPGILGFPDNWVNFLLF